MKKSVLLLTAIFVLALASCTDESTNPPRDCSLGNSLQLQTGNYWVYNVTEIDSNGNSTGLSGIDSCIVERTEFIAGKQAYVVVSRTRLANNNFTIDDILYYAIENGKLYTLIGNTTKFVGLLNPTSDDAMPKMWVKIADCSQTQWSMIDTVLIGNTVKMSGVDTVYGDMLSQCHYSMNGFFKGYQSIAVGNQNLSASFFKNEGAFKSSVLLPPPDTANSQSEVPLQFTTSLWLAEGIGIVRYQSDALDNFEYRTRGKNVNGFRKTLIRYSVK